MRWVALSFLLGFSASAARVPCAVFTYSTSGTLATCGQASTREGCYKHNRDCYWQDAFRRCTNVFALWAETARGKAATTASCGQPDTWPAAKCLLDLPAARDCSHLSYRRFGHSNPTWSRRPVTAAIELADAYRRTLEHVDVHYGGCATFARLETERKVHEERLRAALVGMLGLKTLTGRIVANTHEASYRPGQVLDPSEGHETLSGLTFRIDNGLLRARREYTLCRQYLGEMVPRGSVGCVKDAEAFCRDRDADRYYWKVRCGFDQRLHLWIWQKVGSHIAD